MKGTQIIEIRFGETDFLKPVTGWHLEDQPGNLMLSPLKSSKSRTTASPMANHL